MLIGVVVLLGVSACLTRGGMEASPSVATIATTPLASPDGQAEPSPRRCAFAIFAALPARDEIGRSDDAAATPWWRLADAAASEEWTGRRPERPPRPERLA